MRRRSLVLAAVLFAVISASGDGLAHQRQVTHLVDDYSGSFSPDGKTIIFERWFSTQRRFMDTHPVPQRAVLLVMRPDGSRKRVLRHTGATFEHDAGFSPDGRSILFVRDERIYLMRRDGSGARPVRHDFLEQACPRFSPDGRKISFWRGRPGKSGGYFVMNADGTALRRISRGQRFAWGCPSWFPDGKRLVFAKDYNLFLASSNGTNVEQITSGRAGTLTLYRPSVSPDGRWIACDGSAPRFGYGIFVMRADGTAMRRITTGSGEIENDAGAFWSPDGSQIVFSGYRGRFKGAGIYIVGRDGTGLRRLSNLGG
jgi:Tol biopolymer transport system component